jgi:hypothetical protein
MRYGECFDYELCYGDETLRWRTFLCCTMRPGDDPLELTMDTWYGTLFTGEGRTALVSGMTSLGRLLRIDRTCAIPDNMLYSPGQYGTVFAYLLHGKHGAVDVFVGCTLGEGVGDYPRGMSVSVIRGDCCTGRFELWKGDGQLDCMCVSELAF